MFLRGLIDYEGFLSAFDNIVGSSCRRACMDDINYNLERKNILLDIEKQCVERNNSGNNN